MKFVIKICGLYLLQNGLNPLPTQFLNNCSLLFVVISGMVNGVEIRVNYSFGDYFPFTYQANLT
jgi:hypothetical protein